MMSKSHPNSHPKSRKRSLSKGKHGGLAAKASMEERKPAAKTVKEEKPLSHFVLELFLLLFLPLRKLGRMLFSLGPREIMKEPSLSRERPDAASSSSALATPSGVSVAAKRASEEQTEEPAVEILSFGTVNEKDPCHAPNSTGNSNEASKLDAEVLEAVFSSNGVIVGDIFCPDQVGFRKLKKEEAKFGLLERLPVTEDDEIKSERPGSDSGYWKKKYDDLKKEREAFDKTVLLRQVFSNFRKTPLAKIMDDGIKKEVLKLPAAKNECIDRIIGKASFTRILLPMHFQRANIALKSSFCCIGWRDFNHFPKFSNDSADYQWWEQNFVPEILEKRLEILRVAAKNWNPQLEIFMIIKLVSDVNSRLHRQPSENEFNRKDEVKMFECEGIDLQTTICYLLSGGDSKI